MSPEALGVLGTGRIAYVKEIRAADVHGDFPQIQRLARSWRVR